MALLDGFALVRRATSLGGTVSKAVHVATTTHKDLDDASLAAAGIDPGAVRISIGLEDAADLLADVVQALERLSPSR
jgi:cystathionine beta-lyase/cystathionine gamma-synthase